MNPNATHFLSVAERLKQLGKFVVGKAKRVAAAENNLLRKRNLRMIFQKTYATPFGQLRFRFPPKAKSAVNGTLIRRDQERPARVFLE